jgi:hypothetical protein
MKEQPKDWDKWSVERQIGYNLAIEKSDITGDDIFYRETTSEKIARLIGNILTAFYIAITGLLIISVVTIGTVEVASAIWGEYAVIYWLADLI